MTTLIHVLGADIPHHNQTLLRFFNDVLHQCVPKEQIVRFMVVSNNPFLPQTYPALQITTFASKRQLARAVIAQARPASQVRFFFHGQFNAMLWLALLSGIIKKHQVSWHIWGADLYEDAAGFKYRLFYLLRRRAQARVGRVFATLGDLNHYKKRNPSCQSALLYFPTRMEATSALSSAQKPPNAPLSVLVGNSGDRSNRHISALKALFKQFGANTRVIIPMGYPANNQAYCYQVRKLACKLFGANNVQVITQKLAFDEYQQLLRQCDLGYFIFERQQGVGTLCLLIQYGIPFVLSRANPFCQDLQAQGLALLFDDDKLSLDSVRAARQRLTQIDSQSLLFFSPNYIPLWKKALALAQGEIL